MKHVRSLLLGAACLALASCASVPTMPGSLDVNSVINATRTACSYVPTAATVGGIISTFTGGEAIVTAASDVAKMICNALADTPKAFRRGRVVNLAQPVVRGIPVNGSYVRR